MNIVAKEILCRYLYPFLSDLLPDRILHFRLRVKYRQHNTYVKATCPKEQLLVFNVRQGWGPLCKFLERPVPDVPFPFLNKDASIVDKVAKCEHADYGFMKAVYRESSLRIGLTIVLILLFLCLLVHYLYLNLRLLVP